MKKLLAIAFLFSSLLTYSQGDQTIIKVPISATATEQAILHLPDDYATTTGNYPIIVFLHGAGEGGTNAALIYNNSSAGGPAYFITQKTFPASFVNPADGKSYKFIVVSPQYIAGWSSSPQMLEYILTYLLKTYRVDASRVYLSGLSAGGEGILEYVGKIDGTGAVVNATHPIAAFVPMSAVMNAAYRPRYAQTIVSDRVGIWGFGSPTDTHGANTLSLITWDIQHNIQASYGATTSYSGGHCCWGKFYDPNFKQNGMNIYQWMLQYTTAPPVITPPIVTIPHARIIIDSITINWPNTIVHVSADSSYVTNGSIKSIQWSQEAGPNTAIFASLPGTGMVVSGTIPGIYSVKLYVGDSSGNIDTAKTYFRVNGPVIPAPRTVSALQISLNGIMINVPLAGTKISYSDGNP